MEKCMEFVLIGKFSMICPCLEKLLILSGLAVAFVGVWIHSAKKPREESEPLLGRF
jgi:hypothetical protein